MYFEDKKELHTCDWSNKKKAENFEWQLHNGDPRGNAPGGGWGWG